MGSTRRLTFAVSTLLFLGACHGARAEPPPAPGGVKWPVPAQWRREAFAFPLDFAPDIAYRGTEEIRFMPDFFDPKATTYWSYAFAWIVDAHVPIDSASLERDLVRYFKGLSHAVGDEKYHFDPNGFRASLTASGDDAEGTVDTFDPFTTGRALTLNVVIRQRWCAAAGLRAVVIAASPRPKGDATWRALEAAQSAFECR